MTTTEPAEQLKANRRAQWKDFFRVTRGLQAGDIDFAANGEEDSQGPESLDVEKLIEEKPIDEANSVSSRIKLNTSIAEYHVLAIDVDYDAVLVPTSTPGHHHLVIRHEMTWATYSKLLEALAEAGIIQPGYNHASQTRKASWLRTPWTKKWDA